MSEIKDRLANPMNLHEMEMRQFRDENCDALASRLVEGGWDNVSVNYEDGRVSGREPPILRHVQIKSTRHALSAIMEDVRQRNVDFTESITDDIATDRIGGDVRDSAFRNRQLHRRRYCSIQWCAERMENDQPSKR